MRTARALAFAPHGTSPRRVVFLLGLIACAWVAQVLPHPAGVSPAGAIALFAGASFASPAAALAISLGAFVAGGVVLGIATGNWQLGFHALAGVVAASRLLNVALGRWLRARRRPGPIAAASALGSLQFFALTNLAVWALLSTYPPTTAGLLACYGAGLPNFARALLGDLAYAGALFGALALVERQLPGVRADAARV